eukprot:GFUD01023589.1.p1 GENE.GFUD01023589.1~~GFUD01023589.1.p1  ORF type:complete len:282 (-),score=91.40 GFUD01023589.1:130-975(-)
MDRLNNFRRQGYDRVKEDDEGESLLGTDTLQLGNLHPKKRGDWSPSRHQPRDQTIECDIQPADTLLSLSLKYNIHLAELKRVNNILNDGEFFALKRIKIPVRPTSLLNELLPGVHSEERRNNNGWLVETKESPKTLSSDISSHVSTGQSSPYSETETDYGYGGQGGGAGQGDTLAVLHESRDKRKVKKFLKEMDKDLNRIKEKQTEFEPVIEESLRVETRKFPLKASQIPSEDPGCSNRVLGCWCMVVGVMIVIVFCVLVKLMRIQHDKAHETWGEKTTGQ